MTQNIRLMTNDGVQCGEATRIDVTRSTRIKDGFRAGALFWGLAVCCIPIPLMHFILVPLNVVLGTLRAWDFWTSPQVFTEGHATCPRCQMKLEMERTPAKWPLKILCEGCGFQLRLYESNVLPLRA